MGIVVSWLLRHSRTYTQEQNSDRFTLKYNESAAFYLWLHITETLKYRKVYDHSMSKLCYHLRVLEQHLKCAFPEVYS